MELRFPLLDDGAAAGVVGRPPPEGAAAASWGLPGVTGQGEWAWPIGTRSVPALPPL